MSKKDITVESVIAESDRRMSRLHAPFDPETGEGSTGARTEVSISGLSPSRMWLPCAMLNAGWVSRLAAAGSVGAFLHSHYSPGDPDTPARVAEEFERERCRHDFAYWAAKYIYIKRRGGGDDVTLRLTYPQRKFVNFLEDRRLARKPIRVVLLKARQWGGSTVSQLYMAWLQLVHNTGLNSLIIAHQGTGSDEIKDMFDRAVRQYPLSMLHEPGDEYPTSEKKMVTVGKSGSTFRVPQRNCKIKIGTAERPDSCRGGDYNLVHLSEVGLWKRTEGKKPEDIVRAACGGVMYRPDTMIVYESTANGVGNFFHNEYLDARDNPRSQFSSLFVSWLDIEQNTLEFDSEDDRRAFAAGLVEMRMSAEAQSNRAEPGRYLWWLWERGATLEGINWYMMERAKHTRHGSMAAECPTDDTEAFVNSGASVFDKYKVECLRGACRDPRWVGEVTASRPDTVDDVRFDEDAAGNLWIWSMPEIPEDEAERVTGRYLAVVDIGGRSDKADWSVVAVFDRVMMMAGEGPAVVAQWYGHCDIDLLAWKAAQIAAFYDNALLVIESNTLETHDRDREVDGDQSHFILNQIRRVYSNLYARRQSETDILMHRPRRYGFHTNIATKPMIISTLVKVVREGLYVERDKRCLDEYLVYERRPNGSYGAIPGAHDDLLMTRAIGLHIAYYEMEPPRTADCSLGSVAPQNTISEATL